MEQIHCIFCDEAGSDVVIEENGYEGRKCSGCGLIYISPRPSVLEVQNLYSHDKPQASACGNISGAVSKRLRARHSLGIIEKFIKNGVILEIGPGGGYFLNEARKEGFEVCGIELNNVQADFIRTELEIPCEESPLNSYSFGGKQFDIIYHCNVISHFYDPIADFQKINDKLKDAGLVVFETGNLGDVKEKYYKMFTQFQFPDHLFSFSENNLREILSRTGFELVKIYRYSILPELLISNIFKRPIFSIKSQGRKNTAKISSSNKSGFKKLIKSVYHYFLYLLRFKAGYVMPKKGQPQTVIVIARKSSRSPS